MIIISTVEQWGISFRWKRPFPKLLRRAAPDDVYIHLSESVSPSLEQGEEDIENDRQSNEGSDDPQHRLAKHGQSLHSQAKHRSLFDLGTLNGVFGNHLLSSIDPLCQSIYLSFSDISNHSKPSTHVSIER